MTGCGLDMDVAGLDGSGLDVTGMDGSGLDVTGLDGSGRDVTELDSSGWTSRDFKAREELWKKPGGGPARSPQRT